MGLCWCDSGTGSLLCYGFGTGMWQWYESTPVADIAVNRHQSSTSSLESYSTSKYPQLEWGWKRLEWGWNALKWGWNGLERVWNEAVECTVRVEPHGEAACV